MEIKNKIIKIQWGEEKVLQIARELEALLNRRRPKVLYHNLAWDKFLKWINWNLKQTLSITLERNFNIYGMYLVIEKYKMYR